MHDGVRGDRLPRKNHCRPRCHVAVATSFVGQLAQYVSLNGRHTCISRFRSADKRGIQQHMLHTPNWRRRVDEQPSRKRPPGADHLSGLDGGRMRHARKRMERPATTSRQMKPQLIPRCRSVQSAWVRHIHHTPPAQRLKSTRAAATVRTVIISVKNEPDLFSFGQSNRLLLFSGLKF